MAVTFSALRDDGTQIIDGTHDFTVNNNNTAQTYINTLAAQWLISQPGQPPMTTTIPGQVDGRLLYPVILDYIAANAANFSPQDANTWDRIRIAVAISYRGTTHILDWR